MSSCPRQTSTHSSTSSPPRASRGGAPLPALAAGREGIVVIPAPPPPLLARPQKRPDAHQLGLGVDVGEGSQVGRAVASCQSHSPAHVLVHPAFVVALLDAGRPFERRHCLAHVLVVIG